MQYRWKAPHSVEGLCGPGHKLTKKGCAICGPTVRLSPSVARRFLERGDLEVARAEAKAEGPSRADVEALIADIARQSKANASLQAQVEELRAQLAAEREGAEDLGQELEASRSVVDRLRLQLADANAERQAAEQIGRDLEAARAEIEQLRAQPDAPAPAPRAVPDLLDELTNAQLVELAELVRVALGDGETKAFTGRAERRARAYLDTSDEDVVRQQVAVI